MAMENINAGKQEEVVVVMVPLAAQGHLNQLLHLSRHISAYDIPVHYVTTTTHIRQAKLRVQGWDPLSVSNIFFHELSPPPPTDSSISSTNPPPAPDPNTHSKIPTHLFPSLNATLQLREQIGNLLKNLSNTTKRLVIIHDELMSYQIQDVPTISNAESYCFYSISVFALYTYIWEIFGKPNVPESEFLSKNLPSNDGCFAPEFLEYTKKQREFKNFNSGNLYNTCRDIEGRYIDLVAQALQLKLNNHWAIGPFNPVALNPEKSSNKESPALKWLDQQPLNSVIFVSFGTTTSFTDEEIKEIANGLEKSGQRFIWVLRDADTLDIFKAEGRKARLPEGYEERIKGRGMIIRDWAPQLEILGHPSTGGFMSHCGWNSTIESISFGVPIAVWPMHSDQPRNGVLITELLKIGIVVRDWANRGVVVTSETIENVVRRLMDSNEGEEMRKRAVKLSEGVKKSVEEGGQSRKEMESFISHIRR